MKDIFGARCSELSGRSDPNLLLAKMFMALSAWRTRTFALRWNQKATPSGRLLFQLWHKTPRIKESEYGLLPTPNMMDGLRVGKELQREHWKKQHAEKKAKGISKQYHLSIALNFASGTDGRMPSPNFVEWMMGYPQNWTKID